jgi:pimeloyl-ACP methyl ester carboxylesterase
MNEQIIPNRLFIKDDIYLAYHQYKKKSNTKPGVIYLSGFGGDMDGNKALAVEKFCVENNHDFIRFDYLGHGKSSGEFENFTILDWVDNALKVLDELTTGPQLLVGSSMGGWIMLQVALHRKERVAGLVGIAPAQDFTELLMWNNFTQDIKDELETNGKILLKHESGEDYFVTKRMIEDGRKMLVMNQAIDIDIPVTIVHGMKDHDVPYQLSLDLVNKLGSNDVELYLVKDANHRFSDPDNIDLLLSSIDKIIAKINNINNK